MAKHIKTLVVYFSRSGQTARVAELVAHHLNAETKEEITEVQSRRGPVGYIRSAWEAMVGSSPSITSPLVDPSDYQLVVLACPVWMSRMASPMRTYLIKMENHLPKVALVVTEGGSGGHRVLMQMRELTRKTPLAELVLSEDEIAKASHLTKIKLFCDKLVQQFEKELSPISVPMKSATP